MGYTKENFNLYKYTECLRVTHKDNLVILASEESREWIKISDECFTILNKVLEMNLNHSEILECFELETDKVYFDSLLEKLYGMRILKNKEEKTSRKIEELYLIVTDRCNLSCTHCCAGAPDLTSKDGLDTDAMCKIIDKILQLSPSNVTISGGEPLVRSDIWVIMEYLKSKFNGNVDIMTNGLLINEGNINYIKKYFDNISISVDGVDEESCKIIRGNNVFKNVIKKIEFLKSNGIENISTSAVLPNNESIRQEFEKLNYDLGTKPIFRHFSHKGRAGENYKKISVQMNEYLRNRNMKEKSIIDWQAYISTDKRDIKTGSCGGCESTLSIGSNGEIYPCNLLMDPVYSIGNILEIEDIVSYINNMKIDSNKEYKAFIDLKQCNNDKCRDCSVKSFCWTCPAECDDFLGKENLFEDRCNQVKPKLTSVVWG